MSRRTFNIRKGLSRPTFLGQPSRASDPSSTAPTHGGQIESHSAESETGAQFFDSSYGQPGTSSAHHASAANDRATTTSFVPSGVASRVSDNCNEFFVKDLTEKYQKYVEELKSSSPRILLVGDTGTGKSNLVNIVFGFRPEEGDPGAEVRAGGRPCTQVFAEYGPSDLVPVRIIDSKGVEKMTVQQQMEDLRGFIASASASPDAREHLHIVWYFVNGTGRFQEADALLIRELQRTCGVLVILNKRDLITAEAAENTVAAIRAEFPDIKIAECGDPRGTSNWIPAVCEDGHDEICVNMRRKTWRCQHIVSTHTDLETGEEEETWCSRSGNDQPFGHKDVVDLSLTLLPEFCRLSFLTAQKVDLQKKHMQAAKIIVRCAASAAGVGATPIPFADMPILFAIEAGMAAELIACYGVPVKILSKELITVAAGIVGVGGGVGYVVAQGLKSVPTLNLVGASMDMMVAGTTVFVLGVALSAVLTKIHLSGVSDPQDMTNDLMNVARKLSFRSVLGIILKMRKRGLSDKDAEINTMVTSDMIASATEDRAE